MAYIVGTGNPNQHLWMMLFAPGEVHGSYAFASSSSHMVTSGLHYDCGCVIDIEGNIRGHNAQALRVPTVYLAYLQCFGAICMSMLLPTSTTLPLTPPPPAESPLVGPVFSPSLVRETRGDVGEGLRSKTIHFAFERVTRGWQCLTTGTHGHLTALLASRATERFAWLARAGQLDGPFLRKYTTLEQQRAAEAAFHQGVYVVTMENASWYEDGGEDGHDIMQQIRQRRHDMAALTSTVSDLTSSLAMYAANPAKAGRVWGGVPRDVSVLERFLALRPRLGLLVELPAIVELYQWLHQAVSGNVRREDLSKPLAAVLRQVRASDAGAELVRNGVQAFNRVFVGMEGMLRVGVCAATNDFNAIDEATTPLFYLVSDGTDAGESDMLMRVVSALVQISNDFLDGCALAAQGHSFPSGGAGDAMAPAGGRAERAAGPAAAAPPGRREHAREPPKTLPDPVTQLLLLALDQRVHAGIQEACQPGARGLLLSADASVTCGGLAAWEGALAAHRLDGSVNAAPRFDLVHLQRWVVATYIAGRCHLHTDGLRKALRVAPEAAVADGTGATAAMDVDGAVGAADVNATADVGGDPAPQDAMTSAALQAQADRMALAAVALGALDPAELQAAIGAVQAAVRRRSSGGTAPINTAMATAPAPVRLHEYLVDACGLSDVAWCPPELHVHDAPLVLRDLERRQREWTHLSQTTTAALQQPLPAHVAAAVRAKLTERFVHADVTDALHTTLSTLEDLAPMADKAVHLDPTDRSLRSFFETFATVEIDAPLLTHMPSDLLERHYVAFHALLLTWRRELGAADAERTALRVQAGGAAVDVERWHELPS